MIHNTACLSTIFSQYTILFSSFSIFSCQCDSSNICIATSESTSAIEDDSQIRICLTSNELIQDITFLQITQTDADGIESITEPEILFSVSPDDPSTYFITLPNTVFVQGSSATLFGLANFDNSEEFFSLGLSSESSSECLYALLLFFLCLFASISPPFFYLDCLSAVASSLGYDLHPEFTLSTTKEVGGCNCETTGPSPSLQLSPPPPQINDCPETALISTSQQNEVTFCYCSRLDIENIMSLALTHEFGDIELYIIHLGFVLDESTTKMEIQGNCAYVRSQVC